MQSATTQKQGTRKPEPAKVERPRARKKLGTLTKLMAALITLGSLGIMFVVLTGIWPPKSAPEIVHVGPTAEAIAREGLVVEKGGDLKVDPGNPDQVIAPVKVTNHVMRAKRPGGTPVASNITPVPEPAKVLNADIRVIFYRNENGGQKVVGSAYGNVTNLDYNGSKVIETIGIGVGDLNGLEWRPVVDSMWTDKDAHLIRHEAFAPFYLPAPLPRTP